MMDFQYDYYIDGAHHDVRRAVALQLRESRLRLRSSAQLHLNAAPRPRNPELLRCA